MKRRASRQTLPGHTSQHREYHLPEKTCGICKQSLAVERFPWRKNKNALYYRHCWCKECIYRKNREWHAENSAGKARASVMRRYGVTIEWYEAKVAEQNGVCAICRLPPRDIDPRTAKPRRLSVDHNHSTKTPRGLLCTQCNQAIGLLREDPALFHAAMSYLEQHKTT